MKPKRIDAANAKVRGKLKRTPADERSSLAIYIPQLAVSTEALSTSGFDIVDKY
jgi:hypothetical protein